MIHKSRVGANQVKFGQRGRTKMGWIHRSTPTRYLIWFEEDGKQKTVWRSKDMVTFVKTGRRGKVNPPKLVEQAALVLDSTYHVGERGPRTLNARNRLATWLDTGRIRGGLRQVRTDIAWLKKVAKKNPCPKRANLARQDSNAIRLSKRFHGKSPRWRRRIRIDWPERLTRLGACTRLDYLSDKFDGRHRIYFHKFKKAPELYADPNGQHDGCNLLVLRGKFKIKAAGITG